MPARLELVLYHGLDTTGLLELSTTSVTGPWTALRLTAVRPLSDALAEWQALAASAFPTLSPAFVCFNDGTGRVSLGGSLPFWVRMSTTLSELLGMGATVVAAPIDGPAPALGYIESIDTGDVIAPYIIFGSTLPVEREGADLVEYRAGRATSYHFGRTSDVTIEITVPVDVWSVFEGSPLLSGHGAFRATDIVGGGDSTPLNPNPYGQGNLDGYLLVYPYETVALERESPNDPVHIELRCTMEDPP